MFDMISQGVGAGLEFAGAMMDRNAGISLKTLRRRGRAVIEESRARDALFGGLEEAALKTAQQKELKGYQGARAATELAGIQARRGIQDRGAQAQAAIEQSVVGRGLTGTSTGVQLFGGIQDQTSRQLADLDMQLAQQLASLGLDQAETEGRQGREIAGLRRNARDYNRELDQFYSQILTSGNITK